MCENRMHRIFWSSARRQSLDGRSCISTVSLGVLKERTPHGFFNTSLPVSKLEAIEGFVLGSIDTFYVEFVEPFWPSKWARFSLMWSAADLARLQPDELWIQDVFSFYPVDYQPNILLCGWMLGGNAMKKCCRVRCGC